MDTTQPSNWPVSREEFLTVADFVHNFLTEESKTLDQAIESGELHVIVQRLPAFVSSLNFLSYLRGQDGMMMDSRPPEVSQSIRKMEDAWLSYLTELVQKARALPDGEVNLVHRLTNYFVEATLL